MKFNLKFDGLGKSKPKKRTDKKRVRKAKSTKPEKKKEKIKVEGIDPAPISSIIDETESLFDIVSSSLKGFEFPEDENDLPDPIKLMEKAIDANFDLTVFSDHEFPKAANVIEWSRGYDFLNAETDLFPRQFQTLALFFSDVCFFCSDVDYVHTVPVDANINDLLDRFALLQHGVCPICQRNRSEILHEWIVDPKFYTYHDYDSHVRVRPVPHNELCCVWGQRSGKSHMTSTYVDTYQIHRYLSLPNPLQYYNEPGNKIIEGTFVATTLPQVNKALWIPFLQAMEHSTWYRDTVHYFKTEGKRLGTQLYRAAQTYVMFPTKRLILQIAAANSSGLRGGTRCLTGNALISTTSGLTPIKSTVDGRVWIKNKSHKIVGQQETGTKPVQKTVLESGYSIRTTLDHLIKVLTPEFEEVWKEAKDLELGDYVAVGLGAKFPKTLKLNYIDPKRPIPRFLELYELMGKLRTFTAKELFDQTGLKGIYTHTHRLIKRGMLRKAYIKGQGSNAGCIYHATKKFSIKTLRLEQKNHAFKNRDKATIPTVMTTDLGYLLGYYASEGAYAKNASEFTFSNTNELVVKHFIECFERVFNFTPRIGIYKAGSGKTSYAVAVAYKRIKKFLRHIGMKPSVAQTKQVPWSILQSPKSVVLAFLSAYIEGDGSISEKYITAGSASWKLLHQIQLLLLNLGIVSKVHRTKKAGRRLVLGEYCNYSSSWSLRLRRYDSIQLATMLTCPTKGKFFNYELGKRLHHHYKIPHLPGYVDTSQFGGSTRKHIYVLSSLNERSYNSYALKRLEYEDRTLYKKVCRLIDTGIIWFPVIRKKQLGSRPVFDLSIDSKAHAFTADGIVVHNCLTNIDELGWFGFDESGKKRSNIKDGTEVFRSANNSLTTLRSKASMRRKAGDYNAVDALMINVSSPSSKWDPIMSRAAMAEQKPRIYYTHHSSFEVNPTLDEDEVCDEFAGEPEKLYRDFYAIPPASVSPFFSDKDLLEDRVYTGNQPEFLFTYSIEDSGDGSGLTVLQPTLKEIRPDKTWPRVLAVDNGEKKNSLAMAIARYLPEIEGLLLEEFIEVAPHDGMSIDLAWSHNEFVLKLIENFNIPYVSYDRWQSGYSFYDLRMNKGLTAERHSLKWADFKAFKDDLLGENIWVTAPEPNITIDEILRLGNLAQRAVYPRTNFLAQILTVNEFGRAVVKPEFGNDDLFRCAVLCHYIITKYKKDFKSRTKNLVHRVGSGKVGCKRANVLTPGSFNLPRSWYGKMPGHKPSRYPQSRSGYPKGR